MQQAAGARTGPRSAGAVIFAPGRNGGRAAPVDAMGSTGAVRAGICSGKALDELGNKAAGNDRSQYRRVCGGLPGGSIFVGNRIEAGGGQGADNATISGWGYAFSAAVRRSCCSVVP